MKVVVPCGKYKRLTFMPQENIIVSTDQRNRRYTCQTNSKAYGPLNNTDA